MSQLGNYDDPIIKLIRVKAGGRRGRLWKFALNHFSSISWPPLVMDTMMRWWDRKVHRKLIRLPQQQHPFWIYCVPPPLAVVWWRGSIQLFCWLGSPRWTFCTFTKARPTHTELWIIKRTNICFTKHVQPGLVVYSCRQGRKGGSIISTPPPTLDGPQVVGITTTNFLCKSEQRERESAGLAALP